MSGLNSKFFPAAAFTKSQREKERKAHYTAWKAGVSDEWLRDFIQSGLAPFLRQCGYSLTKDTRYVQSCIRQWAFGHVLVHRYPKRPYEVQYVDGIHPADAEAYDWYRMEISSEIWEKFFSRWFATEFLDTSDVGLKQRDDLPECVWRLIDLNSSSSHQKFINSQPYEDSDDDQHYVQHQEDHAFTGDRRTH